MSRSVPRWYRRISRSATVPGRYRILLPPAAASAFCGEQRGHRGPSPRGQHVAARAPLRSPGRGRRASSGASAWRSPCHLRGPLGLQPLLEELCSRPSLLRRVEVHRSARSIARNARRRATGRRSSGGEGQPSLPQAGARGSPPAGGSLDALRPSRGMKRDINATKWQVIRKDPPHRVPVAQGPAEFSPAKAPPRTSPRAPRGGGEARFFRVDTEKKRRRSPNISCFCPGNLQVGASAVFSAQRIREGRTPSLWARSGRVGPLWRTKRSQSHDIRR